jgi:hypothetical protein
MHCCDPHCTVLKDGFAATHKLAALTLTLRTAGTLQGVAPSCCGHRVAVWSGVCVRASGF